MLSFSRTSNLALASCFLAATAVANISSDFTFDDEDWVVSGDATSATPDYHATGGNPGGFLSADDTVSGGVWYWDAPAKFLGDQSLALGLTLSFELAQSSVSSQFNASDVILDGASMSLHFDTANNPGTDFTPYSIDLTSTAGWRIGSVSGIVPTATEFADVLGDLTRLRIRGEFRSGADTGKLDNVVLATAAIPEASSLAWMFGLAALALRPRRR